MTVSGLIDYLHQFSGNTRVFLTDEQMAESDYEGDYISLESLSYHDDTEDNG